MMLLIDNYDSFTYNLYQIFSEAGVDVRIYRNDQLSLQDIEVMKPEAIIISPGPKDPQGAGISLEVVRELYDRYPIFGVCLGHQCIGAAFGAEIIRRKEPIHGMITPVRHKGDSLFESIPEVFEVMRYHSLIIKMDDQLPIQVIARDENDEIMAIRHEKYPVYGLQFHPESIGTAVGKKLVNNFINLLRRQ